MYFSSKSVITVKLQPLFFFWVRRSQLSVRDLLILRFFFLVLLRCGSVFRHVVPVFSTLSFGSRRAFCFEEVLQFSVFGFVFTLGRSYQNPSLHPPAAPSMLFFVVHVV